MCTTFACFLAALLAFESGWDRDRYDAGVIADWQLTQWAGDPVETVYPGYTSWSQLSDGEWEAMSYRSTNSLGFVGYQFGEALLIDLGYYQATTYYGAGASTNTWAGTWTGKNGVHSLDDFKTRQAQTAAIQEAFGYNLSILQNQLAAYGKSLDDYIGTAGSYTRDGETVSVNLTLSGILAASHLRGAWGTASLLLDNAVSADENGTSILQYIDQFGGYDTPGAADLIGFYDGTVVGEEGLGLLLLDTDQTSDRHDPGDTTGDDEAAGDGEEADTPTNRPDGAGARTLTLAYDWGRMTRVDDFDPARDIIDFGSLPGADIEITEVGSDLMIQVKNNGGSGYLLRGIQAEDLTTANLTAAGWNPVLTGGGGVVDQLQALGGEAAH